MNITLWVVQIILALAFLLAGTMKSTQPVKNLATRMTWVNSVTPWNVRLIGILEILGGIGLILPAVTHTLPWLTPTAAVGLVLTMVGAIIVHIRLKEFPALSAPVVLLLLAIFVAYGRFVIAPF